MMPATVPGAKNSAMKYTHQEDMYFMPSSSPEARWPAATAGLKSWNWHVSYCYFLRVPEHARDTWTDYILVLGGADGSGFTRVPKVILISEEFVSVYEETTCATCTGSADVSTIVPSSTFALDVGFVEIS
jgi:hypothetical protein